MNKPDQCMNHDGVAADPDLVAECGPPLCGECASSAILPPGPAAQAGRPGFLARALAETFGEQTASSRG